jgi:type I restriction enzyme, S subunit
VLRGRLDLSEVQQMELFAGELERLRLEIGDLLIVEGNGSPSEIGRVAIWSGAIVDCVHQNHIIRARPIERDLSGYLGYYWNSSSGMRAVTSEASSTSGLYTLSVGKVARVPIPLAPLSEQRRIVEAIEEQFTRLDAAVAGLKRVQATLKRYRASVLKAACEGRLVPTEAELARAEGREYEPADRLLARILEQRRAWGGAKYKEPAVPSTSDLPYLPAGWVWTTLGHIFQVFVGATPSRARPEFWGVLSRG